MKHKAVWSGPSIQIDPLFAYYTDRSADSIAEEIELAGYRTVHYFVVSENKVNRELIDAFHAKGIAVWALVIGNGTFSTDGYPAEWPGWQMELLKPANDGFIRLSPFSGSYRTWKKAAVAALLTDYPFDGIEFAEPFFPEWDGIRTGTYGDVGPLAQAAFEQRYQEEIPDFRNPGSPRYYLSDTKRYRNWVEFRVEAVNDFLDELLNGAGGARDVRPDIAVATWSLAIDDGPRSVERLREIQGLDAPAMIAKVKPDIHVLQTHWPDWTKSESELPPDYIKAYRPFADAIRAAHPGMPIAVQADIGSAKHMLKSREWLNGFSRAVKRYGYAAWTAYEYHLGKYMYDEKPVPLKVQRIGARELVLSFNKRIDGASVLMPGHVLLDTGGHVRPLFPEAGAKIDGNRIVVYAEQLPRTSFELVFANVTDTPSRWLFNEHEPNAIMAGTHVVVPGR
ncbi:N-acyl-D-glucosamine 2-epimerase [Paenibacillus sp. MBLB4367]|uniref:N-acyl-D-glucosamine 2-epimerase n=1 Tax=Paenibacillus sp. MBLB4367 TaxID=3384767 RepID=UPI0039080825